jgi:hypothetical protein
LISYGGIDQAVCVWDLMMQRCVQTFGASPQVGYIDSLFYVAGRIVTTSQHSTSIWKLDGSLVHSISFQEDLITCCNCSTTSEFMFSMH